MTIPENTASVGLGSDAPLTDPNDDTFGYAAFAKRIADALLRTSTPRGLVTAVNAPWGAGKTSLLNFVKYYLDALPKKDKPIVIDFNPWWFDDRSHLASQFLMQFKSRLPHESELLRKVGDMLADYADALGKAVSVSTGVTWIDFPVRGLLKLLKRKPKDVPTLKAEIAKALQKTEYRFVFVIDDIDRLTPEEIRELFKVVKALADFPSVIYLLAFDRQVIAQALNSSLKIDGDAYVEKIVQAPFQLPAVDRQRLRRKLSMDIERLLRTKPLLSFDSTYWWNVYYDGLDHFIETPRDVVRVMNALYVTYPAIAGELNPVDFIALEFLRVFEPIAYHVVRQHREYFAIASDRGGRDVSEIQKAFHQTWLQTLAEQRREPIKALLSRLFPRFGSLWDNMHYQTDWNAQWRQDLRVCYPDFFDYFFQFGLPGDALSRNELDQLITRAANSDDAIAILSQATTVVREDGTSKASDYLERLRDLKDEINPVIATGLLKALFTIGDHLLVPGDEQTGSMMPIPNRWRLQWAVSYLLERVPEEEHSDLLTRLVRESEAPGLCVQIISTIDLIKTEQKADLSSPLAAISSNCCAELKIIVANQLGLMPFEQLLEIPDLDLVFKEWGRWAGYDEIRARVAKIIESDSLLALLLEKYVRVGSIHAWSDRVSKPVIQLDPRNMEAITDINALELRVSEMMAHSELTPSQRVAAEAYLKEMSVLRQDKAPNDDDAQ